MAKPKSKKITLEKALVPLEEQPYEVPENWCWIKLGAISSIISKGTTPKGGKSAYVDEGIDFLRVENINDDGTICHDDMMHITEETHTDFLKRSILEVNDILVSIAGTLGKTAIVKNDDLPLNTNQAVAFVRLKDNGEISREYIRYAIDTPVIQNMLLSKTKVTAIPNLTLEIISECLIPFPPLAEQQRIVGQIESLFSKLDEANEKAQEVIDRSETNSEAILYNAFSGKLTQYWRKENGVDYNWEKSTLSKIVSGLKYGSSEKSDYNNNGTPVLRIPNIGEGVIDFSDLKYMQGELGNSYHEVFENDILIIRSNGSRDLVGKCAIVPALEQRYAYASFLIRIKASDKVLPKYLVRYINSSMARGQLFAKAKSSSGIHNINSKELGSIRIDVPTIEEQTEILKIIEPLIKKELDVKNITSNMIENIAELKKSILAKAFRGELGTNVSLEESSIELLKKTIEEG